MGPMDAIIKMFEDKAVSAKQEATIMSKDTDKEFCMGRAQGLKDAAQILRNFQKMFS